MFEKLEIFQMASGLARHASVRQTAIAENIANADTPGFKARDIRSFSETYQTRPVGEFQSTRAGHFNAPNGVESRLRSFETTDPVSPNGNSVSLETEMVRASDVRHQHELALSVYAKSMDILRASLGRR